MNKVSVERWINVGQRPVRRYFPRLGFMLAVLIVGSIAVANRSILCQLQAYAILIITMITLILCAQHASIEREFTIESHKDAYCVDCRVPSRVTLIVGRQAKTVSSGYERLYFSRPREYLLGFCWLAWIAYGSVFHEGKHSEQEDAYVADVIQYLGNTTVVYWMIPYARVARTLILWTTALASTKHLIRPTIVFLVFFVLLFAPSSHSTPQALGTYQIIGRTCMFATLFFLSEILERAVHYTNWIKTYDETHKMHLSSVMMSLGFARPASFKQNLTSEALVIGPPLTSGRVFSLDKHLVRWAVVMNSAWILVASDWAIVLGIVQMLLQLAWLTRARWDVLDSARSSPEKTRVKDDPLEPRLPVKSSDPIRAGDTRPAPPSNPILGPTISRRVTRQQNNSINPQGAYASGALPKRPAPSRVHESEHIPTLSADVMATRAPVNASRV